MKFATKTIFSAIALAFGLAAGVASANTASPATELKSFSGIAGSELLSYDVLAKRGRGKKEGETVDSGCDGGGDDICNVIEGQLAKRGRGKKEGETLDSGCDGGGDDICTIVNA